MYQAMIKYFREIIDGFIFINYITNVFFGWFLDQYIIYTSIR